TSNASGHRITGVSCSASGRMSAMTTLRPCLASSVAVAAPMPRLPPVMRTMPSALMIVLIARVEEAAGDQLAVRGSDVLGRGRDAMAGIGIAPAEITARAHENVDDGLEFLVAIVVDRARVPRAPQDPYIGGRDVVEMLLVADRCEEFGFVQD